MSLSFPSALPLFYLPERSIEQDIVFLEEDTSRHLSQVLRFKPGQQLAFTDGKGARTLAELTVSHKRKSEIRVLFSEQVPAQGREVTIGISLLKNTGRFEWFLEKAAELGVSRIIPLACARTEKQSYKSDRFRNILISAMLQSRQYYLPILEEPIKPTQLLEEDQLSLIAHCEAGEKRSLFSLSLPVAGKVRILIGPEGDFTPQEISDLTGKDFRPVSLGPTRLRTETAGMVAATALRLC